MIPAIRQTSKENIAADGETLIGCIYSAELFGEETEPSTVYDAEGKVSSVSIYLAGAEAGPYAERLTERIGEEPCNAALLVERGRWYYRRQEWGKALNDFNRALGIDPARDEARQYAEQIEEILAFRYKDIYNP